MERIGIIGAGEIGRALVEGLFEGAGRHPGVFLSPRGGRHGRGAVRSLRERAGVRWTLATDATLVRAIPLPAVRERRSVTVTCPSHPVADSLFEHLGGVLPVADGYVRGLFQGVGRALSDGSRSLHQLAADHETPKGNNERIRTTWFDPANSEALKKALDDLLADLK